MMYSAAVHSSLLVLATWVTSRCARYSIARRCAVGLLVSAFLMQVLVWLQLRQLDTVLFRLSVIVFVPLWLLVVGAMSKARLRGYTAVMTPLLIMLFLLAWPNQLVHHLLRFLPASIMLQAHVALAIIASVIVLCLGAFAALIHWQERYLRTQPTHSLLKKLPALSSMERHFFRLLAACVLSLFTVVITGAALPIFSLAVGILWWKFLLACIACAVFFVILIGHHWLGWRVRQVVLATLSATGILMLVFLVSQPWMQ